MAKIRTAWNKGNNGWTNSGSFKVGHKGFSKSKLEKYKKEIEKLYLEGKSLKEISEFYKVSKGCIASFMKSKNIKTRPKGTHFNGRLSKETRKKLRGKRPHFVPWNKGLIGFKAMEEHYNWKGGISFDPYSPEFNRELKEKIKQRDNFECQNKLGECKGILTIHHIDFNKKNNDELNLIILCVRHNVIANYDRKFYENFYQRLILSKYRRILQIGSPNL